MDPEWYVGQDVREVNEMWEKVKVAGWWTGRWATGEDDRVLQPTLGGGTAAGAASRRCFWEKNRRHQRKARGQFSLGAKSHRNIP